MKDGKYSRDFDTSKSNEPTLEQWAKLYEVAGSIKKIAPWNYLWDSDLITIMLPDREEPVCCSIMGRNGECYAIGVYPGYESITRYYRLLETPEDEPPYISTFEQNCLICYYGDREEISPKEREILKTLNLRFRGRNEWIYFRAMEPGYYPWFIDSEQADTLIQTLQNLTMALTHIIKGELEVDYEGGDTLLRFYSPEKEMWLNKAAKMPQIPVEKRSVIIDDDILVAKLKNKKKNGQRLEFDLLYMPAPIRERKGDRPYLPRLLLIADKKGGIILDQHMADRDELIEYTIIDMIAAYIIEHGRPLSIHVRGDGASCYIWDLCNKLEIKLVEGEGMPVINMFLAGMLDFMD